MKTTIIAVVALAVGVGLLATQRHNAPRSEVGWVNVSGNTLRTDDTAAIDKVALAPVLAKIDAALLINGHHVLAFQHKECPGCPPHPPVTVAFQHKEGPPTPPHPPVQLAFQHKECPGCPPHPPLLMAPKLRVSHSIAALVD